jgi:hypothetical protein
MKISRDALVEVGRMLSAKPTPKVDTVDVAGETIPAQEALDAFEQAQQAAAQPPGVVGRTVQNIEAKADEAKGKMMNSAIGRFFVNHVNPVAPLVQHEPITLHYADGTSKDTDLPLVDTTYNRAMHDVQIGTGLSAFVPGLGMLSYAGAALGTAVAAGEQKLTGHADRAQNLWQTAETDAYRAAGTIIPLAGHVVNAYIIAQEARARAALNQPASVGQVTANPPA